MKNNASYITGHYTLPLQFLGIPVAVAICFKNERKKEKILYKNERKSLSEVLHILLSKNLPMSAMVQVTVGRRKNKKEKQ